MLMTSAPSRLPASSKELWVRVESSKNRLIWVRPGQHRLLLADLPVELDIAVGEIENGDDLLAGQRRDGENMPAFQDRRRRRGGELCSMGHQSAVYRKTRANRQ